MYKATEIAKYVINRSYEFQSPVSNLKLQKLLYYIQAATLVEKGKKCFDDPIIAWEFGPVVVDVYQTYREYGRGDIPKQEECKNISFDSVKMKIVYSKPQEIQEQYRKIIDKVIRAYSQINNPFDLVKKTHQEDPWKSTNINSEISCDNIKQYYSQKRDKLYS